MEALGRCLGARFGALLAVVWLLIAGAQAETLPPQPAKYFNDYAGVVSPAASAELDERLRQFERETSNQIVAAIFPNMETESSIEDFTQRIFESWKVGQEKLDNGAILFVFIADRKMRIHTGYGLEGALPDITCRRIIEQELKPAFRQGNYEQGITSGLAAMMQAAKGEYQGTGAVAGEGGDGQQSGGWIIPLLFILFALANVIFSGRKGTSYDRRGRHRSGGWGVFPMGGGGGSWGGGGGSWGGGGGGGGFSGGGGSSGGGGASGSW
jgi:uncharacterized protein